MKKIANINKNEPIFIGMDIHKNSWTVTLMTREIEIKSCTIKPEVEDLLKLLKPYKNNPKSAVYEAGYFGYTLHDKLHNENINCIVTPPSLIPSEQGNKVKTDKKDSRKLAYFLSKDLLKRIYVPPREEREYRQLIRNRRQFMKDRTRVKARIKSFLCQYGLSLNHSGTWSKQFIASLHDICFENKYLDGCFKTLLIQLESLEQVVTLITAQIRHLAKTKTFKENVLLLTSIYGVGILTAMEFLLEIGDIERFSNGNKLAAYLGLTPSQYSSGDRVRMGRITRIGKSHLRAMLIEASWTLIRKESYYHKIYTDILVRSNSKKAIVAVARRLALLMRTLLLNQSEFEKVALVFS